MFNAEAVTRIYLGKDKICRCGCAGEYVRRGDAKFDKRVQRFSRMWAGYSPLKDDVSDTYLNVSYGQDRAMTVYFD